jgi:hypothetical protein
MLTSVQRIGATLKVLVKLYSASTGKHFLKRLAYVTGYSKRDFDLQFESFSKAVLLRPL